MRCPYCASPDTQVKDSRPAEENVAIRRRRICPDCGGRFTTFERVQLRELTIIKRAGRKVPLARDKLLRAVELESSGETEIPSSAIGELVIEGLKGLDPVAYVRFASVYRDFREAADFQEVLSEIARDTPEVETAMPVANGQATAAKRH